MEVVQEKPFWDGAKKFLEGINIEWNGVTPPARFNSLAVRGAYSVKGETESRYQYPTAYYFPLIHLSPFSIYRGFCDGAR